MTKKELDLLEKLFVAEIGGQLYQCKNKVATELENQGFISMKKMSFGRDRFGEIIVTGYALEHAGRMAYCSSDRCKNADISE